MKFIFGITKLGAFATFNLWSDGGKVAWDDAIDDPFMFATGSNYGVVRWRCGSLEFGHPDEALECVPTPTNVHDYHRTSSPYQMDSNMTVQYSIFNAE